MFSAGSRRCLPDMKADIMNIILGIFEQGMIYAIMALGVYITYKILDFPDLTVDGSFPLGASITAIMITNGANPYLTVFIAMLGGAAAGFITGVIHVKFKIRDLLSGIITMTALYSINLHIATKANVPIFRMDTIFNSGLGSLFTGRFEVVRSIIIILIFLLFAKWLLDRYLKTRSGYLLRAVGSNTSVVALLAKNSGTVKIIGLMISNALVALSGSIMCQQQRFFEVNMGTGTIIIGLASVIIGLNLFKKVKFVGNTLAVIIGSILYKACVAGAIAAGMPAIDMKLITACLFLAILIIGKDRKKKVKKIA
jgi:putative ABC transport system permease protein